MLLTLAYRITIPKEFIVPWGETAFAFQAGRSNFRFFQAVSFNGVVVFGKDNPSPSRGSHRYWRDTVAFSANDPGVLRRSSILRCHPRWTFEEKDTAQTTPSDVGESAHSRWTPLRGGQYKRSIWPIPPVRCKTFQALHKHKTSAEMLQNGICENLSWGVEARHGLMFRHLRHEGFTVHLQ